MDFDLSEDQRAFQQAARDFAQEALLTAVAEDEDEDGESAESPTYSSPPAAPPPPSPAPAASPDEMSAEQLKAHLEGLRPEDFGKFSI